VAIEENTDPAAGPIPGTRITIFLSVLDVHINRSPCAGTVEAIRYEPGLFLNALHAESNTRNESNWVFINTGRHRIAVRQIAGLIARRIVCRVREGQRVRRGQRIGLIRFGSRTELIIPADAEIRIGLGEVVRGGQTVIAVLPGENGD
jgi:phosphatidylserine decarboxylase